MKHISSGLIAINISKDGNIVMFLDQFSNISYSEANSIDKLLVGCYLVKFFIIGDTKGAF